MATTTAGRTKTAFVDRLNVPALATTGAIIPAAVILMLGILAIFGLSESAAETTMECTCSSRSSREESSLGWSENLEEHRSQ